jgi:hypothetical protein
MVSRPFLKPRAPLSYFVIKRTFPIFVIILLMTIEEIRKKFGGKLVGTKLLKRHVCIAVSLLPHEMQKYITTYCWFVGSMDDAWGYTFTGNDLLDQHLIFLSDELLRQDFGQIRWSILHEIGHVIFKHKNNIFVKQDIHSIHHQEEEADAFAKQFISNY